MHLNCGKIIPSTMIIIIIMPFNTITVERVIVKNYTYNKRKCKTFIPTTTTLTMEYIFIRNTHLSLRQR